MSKQVEKVLTYIIRLHNNSKQLLVFEHIDFPEVGIQVPAGTVQKNESLVDALFREIHEEVGLSFHTDSKYLGRFEYFREDRNELHLRNVFALHAHKEIPSKWTHIVKSDDEDKDMKFKVYWMSFEDAAKVLVLDQGKYLDLLDSP